MRLKLPAEGEQIVLPIDSKFPREDYERLQEAIVGGDIHPHSFLLPIAD